MAPDVSKRAHPECVQDAHRVSLPAKSSLSSKLPSKASQQSFQAEPRNNASQTNPHSNASQQSFTSKPPAPKASRTAKLPNKTPQQGTEKQRLYTNMSGVVELPIARLWRPVCYFKFNPGAELAPRLESVQSSSVSKFYKKCKVACYRHSGGR